MSLSHIQQVKLFHPLLQAMMPGGNRLSGRDDAVAVTANFVDVKTKGSESGARVTNLAPDSDPIIHDPIIQLPLTNLNTAETHLVAMILQ